MRCGGCGEWKEGFGPPVAEWAWAGSGLLIRTKAGSTSLLDPGLSLPILLPSYLRRQEAGMTAS